jgi:hypothetical protein
MPLVLRNYGEEDRERYKIIGPAFVSGLQWSQQAVQHRPRGIGLVRNTYTFPIRKAIVCGEERSEFFDCTRFCSTYKWVAVEASTIPHCRKAVDALGVVPY